MSTNSDDTNEGQHTNNVEIPERFRKDGVDVSLGTREDAVIDSSKTEREWIQVYEESETEDENDSATLYWFDIKEISWERKTEIIEDSLDYDDRTDEAELNLIDFYRSMMEETIEDFSVDGNLPVFLKGMSSEVGDKLQDLMPSPNTSMDEVEEGKSDQSSEDE